MTAILYPECNELILQAKTWEYGTIKTHEEIAEIMRLEPKTNKYYSMITRANKQLLDCQKMLKNVTKIGYKVLEPCGYTNEVVRQTTLSRKRAVQAVKISSLAPVDKMTQIEVTRHRSISDRANVFLAMTSTTAVEMKLLNK